MMPYSLVFEYYVRATTKLHSFTTVVFRPRLNVLSFKKEENIMMILALQFWAFLLCCLDTVQTYDIYPSSYCH